MAGGKETRTFDGKDCIVEPTLTAELAIVKAWRGDREGNLVYRRTARTINLMIATAAAVTMAEVERLVEVGSVDPDASHAPGISIDRIVEGRGYEERIERRTVRKRPEDDKPADTGEEI